MRVLPALALAAFIAAAWVSAAMADEWSAARLRGSVVQLVDGAWQPVHRNDLVPDKTVIRTLANGYVDFVRGAETVSLAPDTQIQIFDKGGSKPFTTVSQAFGTVTVDAEVRNVQHFAVETPYLAAVVKGTKFIVTSGKGGASVKVLRGHVEVDDKAHKTHTLLSVGQSATVGDGKSTSSTLTVSGSGVLPAIIDSAGNTVVETVTDTVKGLAKGLAKGLVKGTGQGNGNGVLGGIVGNLGAGGNGGTSNSGSGNSGSGNGVVGNLLGGLGLRLGYDAPSTYDAGPAIWI